MKAQREQLEPVRQVHFHLVDVHTNSGWWQVGTDGGPQFTDDTVPSQEVFDEHGDAFLYVPYNCHSVNLFWYAWDMAKDGIDASPAFEWTDLGTEVDACVRRMRASVKDRPQPSRQLASFLAGWASVPLATLRRATATVRLQDVTARTVNTALMCVLNEDGGNSLADAPARTPRSLQPHIESMVTRDRHAFKSALARLPHLPAWPGSFVELPLLGRMPMCAFVRQSIRPHMGTGDEVEDSLTQLFRLARRRACDKHNALEVIGEMATLIPLATAYRLDRSVNTEEECDAWDWMLNSASLRFAGADCEDVAEMMLRILYTFRNFPRQFQDEAMEHTRRALLLYEMFFAIVSLQTSEGVWTYHAVVILLDAAWVASQLDPTVKAPKKPLPACILEGTEYTNVVNSGGDESVEDWCQHPLQTPFAHRKIPLEVVKKAERYGSVLCVFTPQFMNGLNFGTQPDRRVAQLAFHVASTGAWGVPWQQVMQYQDVSLQEVYTVSAADVAAIDEALASLPRLRQIPRIHPARILRAEWDEDRPPCDWAYYARYDDLAAADLLAQAVAVSRFYGLRLTMQSLWVNDEQRVVELLFCRNDGNPSVPLEFGIALPDCYLPELVGSVVTRFSMASKKTKRKAHELTDSAPTTGEGSSIVQATDLAQMLAVADNNQLLEQGDTTTTSLEVVEIPPKLKLARREGHDRVKLESDEHVHHRASTATSSSSSSSSKDEAFIDVLVITEAEAEAKYEAGAGAEAGRGDRDDTHERKYRRPASSASVRPRLQTAAAAQDHKTKTKTDDWGSRSLFFSSPTEDSHGSGNYSNPMDRPLITFPLLSPNQENRGVRRQPLDGGRASGSGWRASPVFQRPRSIPS